MTKVTPLRDYVLTTKPIIKPVGAGLEIDPNIKANMEKEAIDKAMKDFKFEVVAIGEDVKSVRVGQNVVWGLFSRPQDVEEFLLAPERDITAIYER